MAKILFYIEKYLDDDCSLALRRFIGHMEGVKSIDVEEGKIIIIYDDSKITKEELSGITKDNLYLKGGGNEKVNNSYRCFIYFRCPSIFTDW